MQRIANVHTGGIITNYYCNSACRHCLYSCNARRPREYMNAVLCEQILERLYECGCRSVHIGGGEPFLGIEGLKQVVDAISRSPIHLEYAETNSSWYRNREQALKTLDQLRRLGLKTLLVSISPFHNEFIPLRKIEGVLSAADRVGITVFPWQRQFIGELQQLDTKTTHTLEELELRYGSGYIDTLKDRFGLTMRGRALRTFRRYLDSVPIRRLLDDNTAPCTELLDTSHFHVDLYGNYLPGLCVGLSLQYRDLGGLIEAKTYPFLYTLLSGGINALYELAVAEYDFQPDPEYVSKCELCTHIRTHLVVQGIDSPDLKPDSFYDEERDVRYSGMSLS